MYGHDASSRIVPELLPSRAGAAVACQRSVDGHLPNL